MSLKEFKASIRRAPYVFASITVTTEDVCYVQLVKRDLLEQLSHHSDIGQEYLVIERDGALYIN